MKNLIYFIEFLLVKFLFLIFGLIGFKASSNLGFFIGRFIGPLFKSKSSIIKNLNKTKIFNNQESKKIASIVLGNYGRIFGEYVHLKNFRNNKLTKYISIKGLQYLEQIKREKKKVIFISGHFNNFEIMAMQIEKYGIDLAAIYRPLNNIYLNKTMERIRKNIICKKQIKKGIAGSRKIIENYKKGSSIALMIDQRVREGIKVPFFGRFASTTTIPAQLFKKYGCEVVPIYIERKNQHYFKITVSKPIKFNKNEDRYTITLSLNKILEKMIQKNPEQWIWTHDRWKS